MSILRKAAQFGAVMSFAVAAQSASAAVQVLTFEGLPFNRTPFVGVFNSYGGLTWGSGDPSLDGWINVDAPNECSGACGFNVARTSGIQVATQLHDATSTISSATPFRAISVQLASAWRNGELVTFDGYLGGSMVWSQSFVLNLTAGPGAGLPTLVNFNPGLIDQLRVTSAGGMIAPGAAGSSVGAVIDDFTFDDAPRGAVPEPSAWALLIAGFGVVGSALRRRERRSAIA